MKGISNELNITKGNFTPIQEGKHRNKVQNCVKFERVKKYGKLANSVSNNINFKMSVTQS